MAFKVGFIGVGGISRPHRGAIQGMSDADIVAVCDTNEERTKAAAEEHNAKPYADWREMLDTESLDACWICVPPFAHGEMDMAVVEKGLALYMEKPIAADWRTAADVARAIEKAGAKVGVGYQWRYSPATEKAKAFIADAQLAALVGAWCGGMPGVEWWRRKDGSGGQVIEQTTHVTDLIRYLCGCEPKRVFAAGFQGIMGKKVENYSVDDASVATIQLQSGVTASLVSACMLPCGYHVGIDALTDQGVVRLGGGSVTIQKGRGESETVNNPEGFSAHAEGTKVFIQAILQDDLDRIRSTYADAVKTQALGCAVQASIDRGGEVVEMSEFAL
jgi:predicted dehydrogenase